METETQTPSLAAEAEGALQSPGGPYRAGVAMCITECRRRFSLDGRLLSGASHSPSHLLVFL